MKATETEKGYVTKRFPPALHLTHWETVAKSATRMRLYFRSMPCQQQLSEANKHRAQCNARNMVAAELGYSNKYISFGSITRQFESLIAY